MECRCLVLQFDYDAFNGYHFKFIRFRASSVYAFIGLLLGFAGSFYCDMDTLIFSIEAYRNPFTHSYLLPLYHVRWYAFLVLPLANAS